MLNNRRYRGYHNSHIIADEHSKIDQQRTDQKQNDTFHLSSSAAHHADDRRSIHNYT